MKDINKALRKAYNTALTSLISSPVYANYAPQDIVDGAGSYIVFSNVTNNDVSTKSSSDVLAIMQVAIYSYKDVQNEGDTVDDLTDLVFSAIYSSTRSVLNLGAGFQMLSTELNSDNTQDPMVIGQRVYIDRILQFKHEIFIL